MTLTWTSPSSPLNPAAPAAHFLSVLEAAKPGATLAENRKNGIALWVDAARLVEVCRLLKEDAALDCDLLVAETAVDWLDWFDVVYIVRSIRLGHELVFAVQVPREAPAVPSVAEVWRAAIWMEREVFDLMGITFVGHPDPRRILTWDEFEGHALRKDFGLDERQSEFDQVPPGYKKVGEL